MDDPKGFAARASHPDDVLKGDTEEAGKEALSGVGASQGKPVKRANDERD